MSFGASREARGKVVFHTGLTGYQEILTDPSYCLPAYLCDEAALRKAAVQLGILSITTLTGANATVAGEARGRSASKFAVHAPSENAG